MYAIVESCGRQYQLQSGRFVDIDLIACEPGQNFVFDRVLMLVDGEDSTIGTPHIEGAKVTGRVLSHGRGAKVIVYRMRPKKRTRKKRGHRQEFTRVLINKIELKDKVLAEADSSSGQREQEATTEPSFTPKGGSAGSTPEHHSG